jgi:adenylate cyclase
MSISAIRYLYDFKSHPRSATLVLAFAVWVLISALQYKKLFDPLDQRWYDFLTVQTTAGMPDLPIVVVGIDEDSFAELGMQWPWTRDVHAELVDQLSISGAAVIGFDVLFAEPSPNAAADQAFAKSIKDAGNVVLASNLSYVKSKYFEQLTRVSPFNALIEAGAQVGIANVELDSDLVSRRLSSYSDSFWRKLLGVYHRKHAESAPGDIKAGTHTRFVGPDHSFSYASYYQALNPAEYLPPDFFKDKIVIVGLDVTTSPDPASSKIEQFATPFFSVSGRMTPGVEIHANFTANGLYGSSLTQVQGYAPILLLGLLLGGATLSLRRTNILHNTLSGLAVLVLPLVLSALLFVSSNLWMPALGVVIGVILFYLARLGIAYYLSLQARRAIRTAFAMYVSPAVVDELIDNPDKLVLGGEKRELTLMFTDLAGFTSISESLTPEQVSQLLNEHLTAMTSIVMKNRGTVDKFIGDAIMAFWNAPLDDHNHALNACRSALEMQEEMGRLRERLASRGLPKIHMRIGINTGDAAVGNMGSVDRFAYTAIGDNVNLASRLEGINKLYGSDILVSESTALKVKDQLPTQLIDRVRVKGKALPINIYWLAQPEHAEIYHAAFDAYFNADWEEAHRLWQEYLLLKPDDHIARMYLDRIKDFSVEPPGDDWDGSVALEKM